MTPHDDGPTTRRQPDEVLLGFTLALRAAGVPVTQDRAQGFLAAAAELGAGDRRSTYLAGRATLCAGPDEDLLQSAAGRLGQRRRPVGTGVQQLAVIGDARLDLLVGHSHDGNDARPCALVDRYRCRLPQIVSRDTTRQCSPVHRPVLGQRNPNPVANPPGAAAE